MSDLIERLRRKDWVCQQWEDEAADEIERLREDLGVVDAWRNKVIAQNAKLQAVVDAIQNYIDAGGSHMITVSRIIKQDLAELEEEK